MASLCSPRQVVDRVSDPNPYPDITALIAAHQEMGVEAGIRALRECLTLFAGRIAVVSSFGAQSAVLLAYVAEIAPATPVLFIDTGKLFAETLQYRQDLTERLGLLDVRDLRPQAGAVQARDPQGTQHRSDPDSCCSLRKVVPLERALAPFAAWVNGRRRAQSATRAAIPLLETVDGRVKVNPLAAWSDAQVETEMTRRRLPRHPLVSRGYASIGCAPCTRPARADGDHRSGRWPDTLKTECGIHRAPARRGL
jgi:phosphoadenosine phosphosulfate reductase